jgi:hypothetical protein
MKLAACGRLRLRPINGYWFRALALQHWETRLATDHTRKHPSRYSQASESKPLYRILYLGETPQVVLYEVDAVLGSPAAPVANPAGSWFILSLHVVLDNVADLSELSQQRLLGTNDMELTGVWKMASTPTPTQRLGVALEAIPGLEGFLFPSSKPPGRNLVIFPDKLGPRNSITFLNEINGRHETLT